MTDARSPDGLAPGDALTPELTVMRPLGGGSSYEAWLAFDEVTYAPVVVKVLRAGRAADEASLRSLRREAEALAAVNHPVVVRGLRHEERGERPHLVLEHIDGPRLSSLVRRHGPLQEQQYLPLAIDIASALHYLRRIGYVHLDVKPSNIIMGAPARLIDLSVARTVSEAASTTALLGTDAWMAPEQCDPTGLGAPTPASDVWGLGATLHFGVSGERPFEAGDPDGRTAGDRFPQLAAAPRELPRRVPADVVDVIRACLAPRPQDRPEPREISDALSPVLERQPMGKLTYKVR
jgi:serine/threonine-protein kinase